MHVGFSYRIVEKNGRGGGHTDEHEGIRNVVVAHVDNGRAHPATEALLRTVENRVHHAGSLWRSLHAVQTLASVA